PLSKKLSDEATQLYMRLKKHFFTEFDEAGAIGRRYRRQDEIGTPFCVTYDFDSQTDHCVTVRARDTMAQERIPIDSVAAYIGERLAY
ncbi:MAG: glycine--tRNA ligase, partial [Oscillospiraceae bacterium]|nr:glycine--tRNA ligase [Oscillospiraceae bacterium]